MTSGFRREEDEKCALLCYYSLRNNPEERTPQQITHFNYLNHNENRFLLACRSKKKKKEDTLNWTRQR